MNDFLKMKRIPMDNVENFRSLGGLATGKKLDKVTKHGVFYRSARIHDITPEDKKRFKDLGIHTIVDLRSKWEVEQYPDDTEGLDVHYVNVDVMPQLDPAEISQMSKTSDGTSMQVFYKSLLDTRQAQLADVFHALAKGTKMGATLFHCSIGRDRTGVVSALMLLSNGVDDQDVIVDYQVSETYLMNFKARNMESVEDTFPTPNANMIEIIKYVNENYGSAKSYLKKIGITDEELKMIHEAFVK